MNGRYSAWNQWRPWPYNKVGKRVARGEYKRAGEEQESSPVMDDREALAKQFGQRGESYDGGSDW